MQGLGFWARPRAVLEHGRRRWGRRFTIRLPGQAPFVVLSDPEEIKQLFQAPPDVLHPGEGARVLEPLLGTNSVILLDEGAHLEQRRLLLPAFHGERVERLEGVIAQLAEREVADWPTGRPVALHGALQRLTLEIILRAVFGLERGSRLVALRELLTDILAFSEHPLSLFPVPEVLALVGPLAGQRSKAAQADALIFELIEERRRGGGGGEGAGGVGIAEGSEGSEGGEGGERRGGGEDVLALLLAARHEDGSQMSAQELRDELMTALAAGHETTASQLAWAFVELARHPLVARRLWEEIEAGEDDTYLTATIHEILRRRPVLPNAEPRLVKRAVEIGGFTYPPGVVLVANAYLVHHDPAIYPDPYAFRPERFLERAPGTYTWIPFGGGRRRCLGASFALLEMKVVLRATLRRWQLEPVGAREGTRRRSITMSPARGGEVVLRARARARPRPRPGAIGGHESRRARAVVR